MCVCVFIFILVLSPSPNEGNEIREMQVKCKANCAEGNQMDALLFFVLHIKKNKKKHCTHLQNYRYDCCACIE